MPILEIYLAIGIVCGVIAFFLTLSNTGFNIVHLIASALASVVIVVAWPAWLFIAVRK